MTDTAIQIPSLASIQALTKGDFDRLNILIKAKLYTDVPLVEDVSHYIIESGGKRIRPLLALLAAKALGYDGDHHVLLAAIVEFIHTATLLHDDIIDQANHRRGKETANLLWGNSYAVLVGDFLYSRAFQMMVELQNLTVMDIFASTTNKISEGEVLQLMNCGNLNVTEADYHQTIYYKTAKLFEATTLLAAVIQDAPDHHREALTTFGREFGIAYQLTDDALDYDGNADLTGKKIGQDLSEGKLTLPLIYALDRGNEKQQALIKAAVQNRQQDNLHDIQQVIHDTRAIAYTKNAAKIAVQNAIDALIDLPDSEYCDGLIHLSRFLIERGQ